MRACTPPWHLLCTRLPCLYIQGQPAPVAAAPQGAPAAGDQQQDFSARMRALAGPGGPGAAYDAFTQQVRWWCV
jgi:hypothetical protein